MQRLSMIRPILLLLALGSFVGFEAQADESEPFRGEASTAATRMPRLISLNPSLTAIVLRLDAGEALVGVDDYSARIVPEAAKIPNVGGLFDPSLEAVVGLRPDRVLLVEGIDQRSHGERLERLGVAIDVYPNERLDQVLENIERLGRILARETQAAERIQAILDMRRAVGEATRALPRPKTVAIVDRSPLYLVGGETFLDEMLEAVGAQNLGRDLATGYPRGSIEWLISSRPELLLDMTPGAVGANEFWARWPSLPAVATGRVLTVDASRVSLPGPDLDDALRALATAVHGPGIEAAIDAALIDSTKHPIRLEREGSSLSHGAPPP
jgi:ABC-type Fe3+-hydroxamate transport system substrate-binding protein